MVSGKDQVSVGIVPINISGKSSLSVYPLAIANCNEKSKFSQRIELASCRQEWYLVQIQGLPSKNPKFKTFTIYTPDFCLSQYYSADQFVWSQCGSWPSAEPHFIMTCSNSPTYNKVIKT